MKKYIKTILIISICLITLSLNIVPVLAKTDVLTKEGIGSDLNVYNPSDTPDSEELTTKTGKVLGVIQTVGSVLSVIILIVIGIKYMIGTVEEKAEYKKTFWFYIVGIFLLFTGTLLPKLIYDISTQAAEHI